MDTALLIGGFMLGAAGSLHCIGMCGPLSLALPLRTFNHFQKAISLLSYQLGRIFTYSFFGLLVGWIGRPLQWGQYQQLFSVMMGLLVIIAAWLYHRKSHLVQLPGLNQFYLSVQKLIAGRLKSAKGPIGFAGLGMANGLLPCGLVYVAIASTLSIGNISDSVGFMAAFGAGTLPAMMLAGYSGQLIKPQTRASFQKAVPYFIVAMGLLLIIRGLDLGIPYLSPKLPASPVDPVNCHPA